MPLYEFFCRDCEGLFEQLRSIRESAEPAPCPVCDKECSRVMPTSFAAFSMREGLQRQLPDRGTYWHLGKEVKQMNTGGVPAYEHPELYKPRPKQEPSRGEQSDIRELDYLRHRHGRMLKDSELRPSVGRDGTPNLSPEAGASGHIRPHEVHEVEKAREGRPR